LKAKKNPIQRGKRRYTKRYPVNSPVNISAKRSLSQNFLVDEEHIPPILEAAHIEPTDSILEIGPGLGILTEKLAQKSNNVIAVELDERLIGDLKIRFQSQPHVQIIQGDILKLQLAEMISSPYKVVANLPYHITNYAIRHLLESSSPPIHSVLMVQQEVAERICAEPGNLSILAVSVQFYTEPKIVHYVPASAFHPQPQVNSAIIALTRPSQPRLPNVESKIFFQIVRAGFSQKRKQLLNSLSAGLHLSKSITRTLLMAAEIDPQRRAQSLSLDEWSQIYNSYVEKNNPQN